MYLIRFRSDRFTSEITIAVGDLTDAKETFDLLTKGYVEYAFLSDCIGYVVKEYRRSSDETESEDDGA